MGHLICHTCDAVYWKPKGQQDVPHSCGDYTGRKERELVACSWPKCTEHVRCLVLQPSKFQNYTRYRVSVGRMASSVRYPICEVHQKRIMEMLGPNYKTNGIKAVIRKSDEPFATRSLGYPMARLVLWDIAGECCQKCSKPLSFNAKREWEVDHVIPVSLGGQTSYDNLQVLCVECHEEKSRPERGIANSKRFDGMKSVRWHSHHQKDLLISKQNLEIARLKTIIASYANEEEMAG